jgi:hypothetical protein
MLSIWFLLLPPNIVRGEEFTEKVDFYQLPGGSVATHFKFQQTLKYTELELTRISLSLSQFISTYPDRF